MKSCPLLNGLGVFAIVIGAAACGAGSASNAESGEDALTTPTPLALDGAQRDALVEKKATCPFAGTAVAMKKLLVLAAGAAGVPLAPIHGEGSVVALGDTGQGSDLGSKVLAVFATGNHHALPPTFTREVPYDTFSLDFPGSQGAHAGHSGILMGDPKQIDSGRFDPAAFDRLLAHAETTSSGARVIRRSEMGKFIAENMRRDPNAKVFSPAAASLLGHDLVDFAEVVGPALKERLKNEITGGDDTTREDELLVSLTKVLGEDNLVGSAGEFGLLYAFLAHSPKTVGSLVDDPAISVDDVRLMFGADGTRAFPAGWATWKKSAFDWTVDTVFLAHAAAEEYLRTSR